MTQRADKSNHLHNENQFVLSLHFTSLVAQTVKRPPASTGDPRELGSTPGSGRSPREGNGNPLQ